MQDSARNITPEAMEEPVSEARPKMSNSSFDIKNYLNTKLKETENERSTRIRLLTIDKDSNKPFEHIHMHTLRVPTEISENGWKSYVCLEKTNGKFTETLGNKCPFCELNRSSYNKFKELSEAAKNATDEDEKAKLFAEAKTYKDLSVANIANETGIIRCIERGHEEDGPKFWKFPIRKDLKDPENVIRRLYKTRVEECKEEGIPVENILDIDEGYDLKITISAVFDKQGKRTNKTSINIERYGSKKPLTSDPEQRDAWVNDKKVWSDVFVAKPYEYLEVILDGEIPWFDKKTGKWIPKKSFQKNTGVNTDEVDSDRKNIDNATKEIVSKAVADEKKADTTENDNDGLPF